jgi:hypothetical protein
VRSGAGGAGTERLESSGATRGAGPTRGQGTCPLCGRRGCTAFALVQGRRYLDCPDCRLVHLAPEHHPTLAEERAHYGTHRNDPDDPAYRAFLDRLAVPLADRVPRPARGLDFGSGPAPTLSRMLDEQGYSMDIYDPIFAPDEGVFDRSYDFVTCTEVVEHFAEPRREFDRLDRLVRPGGWVAIMTEVLAPGRDFETWRYARDPTHLCFFRSASIEWVAVHFGWSLEVPHPNVAIYRKAR